MYTTCIFYTDSTDVRHRPSFYNEALCHCHDLLALSKNSKRSIFINTGIAVMFHAFTIDNFYFGVFATYNYYFGNDGEYLFYTSSF